MASLSYIHGRRSELMYSSRSSVDPLMIVFQQQLRYSPCPPRRAQSIYPANTLILLRVPPHLAVPRLDPWSVARVYQQGEHSPSSFAQGLSPGHNQRRPGGEFSALDGLRPSVASTFFFSSSCNDIRRHRKPWLPFGGANRSSSGRRKDIFKQN